MVFRTLLRTLRLFAWRRSPVGPTALVQPLMVRLDPGLKR